MDHRFFVVKANSFEKIRFDHVTVFWGCTISIPPSNATTIFTHHKLIGQYIGIYQILGRYVNGISCDNCRFHLGVTWTSVPHIVE